MGRRRGTGSARRRRLTHRARAKQSTLTVVVVVAIMSQAATQAAKRATTYAIQTLTKAQETIAPPIVKAYERTMSANAQYVVKDEAAAKVLGRQFIYTNLARVPGALKHAKVEFEQVRAMGRDARELDVKTVAIGAAFAFEVYAWFCVGEIIGRGGKLTGY